MYTITLREHIFVARSLKGEVFGPAQNLHGATYLVDVEIGTAALNSDSVVIELGQATAAVRETLAKINYQNLDTLPEFFGANATTEFLARYIYDELSKRLPEGFRGTLKITLHESDRFWASYDAPVG